MITEEEYKELRERTLASLTEEELRLLEAIDKEALDGNDRNTCIDNIETQDNTL